MATIEIRDVLDNETGQTIFPRTHVNAVIGLKDTNFFEAVDDGNGGFSVKLKSEYQGLWAEGWISAGGINSQGGGGGGGGLIQTVYTWSEMLEMSDSPEDDTTSAFNAKTVYEIYKLLQSDGGGYLKESGGGFFLTSSSEKILLKGEGHSLSSLSDVSVYNPSVNDLLVWSGYSWVNVPQSSVRPDMSGYVTVDSFNQAVNNLQAEIDAITSFFEEDESHNVTLKAPYQNLWVPGWLAAGGIGTGGGGGGGVSYLKELSDVYHTSNSNVLRADGTPVNPGDALVYNSTLGWVAAPVSGGGSGTITDVTLGGTSVVSGTIAALPAYPSSLSQLSDDATHRLVTDTQISTWNGLSSRITDIEGWFEVVNVAASGETPVYALHAKNNYAIYSDSWISAGGAGSGSSSGGAGVQKIKVWNTTVTPNASTGVADITSATSTLIMSSIAEYVNISQILTSGTAIATVQIGTGAAFNLYAPSGGGGGGTLSSVGLEMPTGFSVSGSPLQSNGNITVSFANGYKLPTTAKQGNWDTAFSWGDHSLAGYVTQTGVQEISGAKTFKTSNVTLQGINLVPSTNNTCGIGTSSARFASIYGTNADLSGNLSMGANSYIDIGNARIIYDAGAKALHIQGKSGVSDAIGLFADGEVSSGGVAAQSTVSFVTLSGNSPWTGKKSSPVASCSAAPTSATRATE